MRILWIDPGHGGHNRGTTGSELCEADYVLALGLYLRRRAGVLGLPWFVRLSRQCDIDVSLDDRAARAAAVDTDLALILHINGGPPSLRGAETYYWPGDQTAHAVAAQLQRSWLSPLYRRKPPRVAHEPRGPSTSWLQRPRAVLRPYAVRGVSAVLIELGYRTHPADRAALLRRHAMVGLASTLELSVAGMMSAHRFSRHSL